MIPQKFSILKPLLGLSKILVALLPKMSHAPAFCISHFTSFGFANLSQLAELYATTPDFIQNFA